MWSHPTPSVCACATGSSSPAACVCPGSPRARHTTTAVRPSPKSPSTTTTTTSRANNVHRQLFPPATDTHRKPPVKCRPTAEAAGSSSAKAGSSSRTDAKPPTKTDSPVKRLTPKKTPKPLPPAAAGLDDQHDETLAAATSNRQSYAELLDNVQKQVAAFRAYRDALLQDNPNITADEFVRLLKERLAVLLLDLPVAGSDRDVRVLNALLCGQIVNVLPDYDARCEEYLTKAVKLDPDSVDGLNELGQCYWKKPDRASAVKCFQLALQKQHNRLSLRLLSTAVRVSAGASAEHTLRQHMRSVELAKQALAIDQTDAESWGVLGNAYLTFFFFTGQQSASLIKQALQAYAKAVELDSRNADFYYNYSQALRYEQDYGQAYIALQRCAALDPTFTEATDALHNLRAYVLRVHEALGRKGKLRPKKMHEMVDCLKRFNQYGELSKPVINKKSGKARPALTVCEYLSELHGQLNESKMIALKVLAYVVNEESIPYTCIAVDRAESCVAVTVFNCSPEFSLPLGATLILPEPYVIAVQVNIDDKPLHLRCIRVPSPGCLLVNGQRVSERLVALDITGSTPT